MPNSDETAYFLLMCVPERQSAYAAILQSLPQRVEFALDVVGLLSRCISEPPLAVLIDAASSARLGAAIINPVLKLQMTWPVLRCTMRPDGTATVLSTESNCHGTLAEALESITHGDPRWLSQWKRQYVRLSVPCRVRTSTVGEEQWHDGNCLDLSAGGAFILSYRKIAVGAKLDLELWDLLERPVPLGALVRRVRLWGDSPELPGIGVQFDAATVSADLRRALAATLVAGALAQ